MTIWLKNDGSWCEVCLNKVYKRCGRWRNLKVRRRRVFGTLLLPGAIERIRLCEGCFVRLRELPLVGL